VRSGWEFPQLEHSKPARFVRVLLYWELRSEDCFRKGSASEREPGRKAKCYLGLCSGPLPSSQTAATAKAVLLWIS
jgi:hypothetical protein